MNKYGKQYRNWMENQSANFILTTYRWINGSLNEDQIHVQPKHVLSDFSDKVFKNTIKLKIFKNKMLQYNQCTDGVQIIEYHAVKLAEQIRTM